MLEWEVLDGTGTEWDVQDGLVVSWLAQRGPVEIVDGGGGGLTAEQVRDLVAAFIAGGANVTVTHDDAGDTLTIAVASAPPSGGAGGALSGWYPNPGLNVESVQDLVAAFIDAGTGVTVDYDDTAGTLTISATGGGTEYAFLRVGVVIDDPTTFGGSYASDEWTIAALSSVPTTGDGRLLAVLGTDADDMIAASTGLFEHTGSGVFERVRAWALTDAGTWLVGSFELVPGDSSPVHWLYLVGAALGYSQLTSADVASLEVDLTTLSNRMGRFHPTNPVKPELHVSKYVTFDPDFPLDGTATHVGGQVIDNGQNLTILDNSTGNGGVWTLSTTGPATRATGFGAMLDEDIGNYDHVSFTGTKWAYFAVFRLYGDATTRGMSPTVDRDGIIGGEGVSRSYQACLIATDLTGDNLSVLEADGTTTVVDVTTLTGERCVLLLDDLSMLSVDDGVVEQVENFASAVGVWLGRGVSGVGVGTVVATANGEWTALTTAPGSGGGSVASDTIWDAAGDLVYGTGADAAARLALGTRGQALVAGVSAPEWAFITPRVASTHPIAPGDYVLLSTPYGVGSQNATLGGTALAANSNSRYLPFFVGRRVGVSSLTIEVVTGNAGASAKIRMGIHADNNGRPGAVIVDAGTASAAAAVKELTFTEVFLDPGWYFAVVVFQDLDTGGTNPTIRAVATAASTAPRLAVPTSTANQQQSFNATVSGALAADPTVANVNPMAPHIWLKVSTL